MTFTDVWVNELRQDKWTLDSNTDWPSDILGARLTPFFPPGRQTHEPFSIVMCKLSDGSFVGKQIDWGSWAALVTKDQILEFIDEVYGASYSWDRPEHLAARLADVKTAVQSLSSDLTYALIAEEF